MENYLAYRRNVVVTLKEGLHMRPLSMIAQVSQGFDGEVSIHKKDGTSANAKNMFDLLTLRADYGTPLVLEARGEGAARLLHQLALLFAANFEGEDSAGGEEDLSAVESESPSNAPFTTLGPCAQTADSE